MHKSSLTVVLVMIILTSGCLGFVQGNNALQFESNPATVSSDTLTQTGYANESIDRIGLNRTFEVKNQSRTVNITNWNTQYSKDVGGIEVVKFMTVTTPKVTVLGQPLNPVGNMSSEDVLNRALGERVGLSNISKIGTTRSTVLGEETNVTTFEATFEDSGDTLGDYEQKVHIHVTKVAHGEDYVLAVGVHPVEMDEQQNIITLMESLEHSPE